MSVSKLARRNKIRTKIRSKIFGTATRPRLSVFRSNTSIYTQLIDDVKGVTIASASIKDIKVGKESKVEISKLIGLAIAKKTVALGITTVVFDRSGYLYHGRVKALADGAREGGLMF